MVVWNRLDSDPPMAAGRDLWWHELVARQSPVLPAPPLDPATPTMVIYTSGTPGKPKHAVPVQGAFLLKRPRAAAATCGRCRRGSGGRTGLGVVGHAVQLARAVGGCGKPQFEHSQGAHLRAYWRHRRRRHDLAAGTDRRHPQLGLPVLLAA